MRQSGSAVSSPLPVREHHFRTLRGNRPGTVAESVPLVLYRDVIDEPAQSVANLHLDFCSLYIIRSGRGTHVIDGTAYGVARGDVYVMGPGMVHHFVGGESLITHTLHFSPDIFDRTALDALTETPGFHSLFVVGVEGGDAIGRRWLHLTPSAYDAIDTQVQELHQEWQRGGAEAALLTRCLFLRLLIHLSRYYAREVETAPLTGTVISEEREATVAAAVRYLDAHFAEPVRIEQVAAQVYLSPDRFTEVFAQLMGRTPRDYLRHLRLEYAKTLLRGTDLSVGEIARLSGFNEAAYFTRVLRASTGLTPRALRKTTALP